MGVVNFSSEIKGQEAESAVASVDILKVCGISAAMEKIKNEFNLDSGMNKIMGV